METVILEREVDLPEEGGSWQVASSRNEGARTYPNV